MRAARMDVRTEGRVDRFQAPVQLQSSIAAVPRSISYTVGLEGYEYIVVEDQRAVGPAPVAKLIDTVVWAPVAPKPEARRCGASFGE